MNFCPADPLHVAVYFNDIVTAQGKFGTVESAFLGTRWGHFACGLPSPTENKFVKLALEGAKRMLAGNTKRNQKEPVSIEILKSIVDKFAFSENLIELRFVIMCLLGFSGFMRISELLNLKLKDITFVADGKKKFSSKNLKWINLGKATLYLLVAPALVIVQSVGYPIILESPSLRTLKMIFYFADWLSAKMVIARLEDLAFPTQPTWITSENFYPMTLIQNS